MESLSQKILDFISKLLIPPEIRFSRLEVSESVIEDAMEFARAAHPHEFVAILEGRVKENTLFVTGLLYQPFKSSTRSAVLDVVGLPMTAGGVGTVHSHPTPNYQPSREDLRFFAKKGIIHFIIRYPYGKEDIACYDNSGAKCEFEPPK